VQRWLAERLAQRYDLGLLAQAFHTSTRTLLRRYRRETGGTPLAWLQQARVRKAQRLLEGGQRLAEVVAAVGYEDVATFSRLFQRQVGDSPARYRRHASIGR
jgi:AraC-like DNA-binding protein